MEHRQFYKMSMFEGSSHVPLMIMGPRLMSGLQVNQLVSLVDLYPTVLGKQVDREFRIEILLKIINQYDVCWMVEENHCSSQDVEGLELSAFWL